jgi:hypothetical protein
MPERVCETCGAGFFQGPGRPARYCPRHRRYGAAHQAARAAGIGAAYDSPCCRCGKPLQPGEPVHLDHHDDGQGYRGWSHESCNTSAGAARGNRLRAAAYRARVNGPRPAVSMPAAPAAPAAEPPDSLPRHSPDCSCGGTVTWPGPVGLWTSRCW